MVNQGKGLFHFNIRKRMHELDPYPNPQPVKNMMDKMVYVVGVIGPLMTLPQLIKIWIEHNAAGVSLMSWSGYIFTSSFWLAYGLMHKEKPLILMFMISVVIQITIVIGILLYR